MSYKNDKNDDYHNNPSMISSRYSNEEEEDNISNDENITRSIMNQIFNEILCQDDPVHVQSHDNTMEIIPMEATDLSHKNLSVTFDKTSTNDKRSYNDVVLSAITDSLKDELEKKEIPRYLDIENLSLDKIIPQVPVTTRNFISIKQLQQIAFLIHQFKKMQLEKLLWSTSLQCGMGLLKTKEPSIQLWPEFLKNLIQSHYDQCNANEYLNNQICSQVAECHLQQIQQCCQYYEHQLDDKTKSIPTYKIIVQSRLEQFIEKNFQVIQKDYEYKIAMMTYDYEEQRLAYEIRQHLEKILNRDEQIKLIEKLCSLKDEQQKSKLEVKLLAQYIKENKVPENFNSVNISCPFYLQNLHDMTIRQQLMDQHQKTIEDYKQEMILLFLNSSKCYMTEMQNSFDDNMAQFWQYQRSLPLNQRLNPIILNLIEQRLNNLTEKVKCIYQHKLYLTFGKTLEI